ncbi:MAG: sigma-70 family RNA polymerase sigma factor [Lachnospiraceae bacterium]|nr:sigma-70 family RNA polymerase sigma factor [Lachnospiraceae bacterium]
MSLSNQSDEKLVSLAKENDKEATDVLLLRYSEIVKRLAGSYFLVGGEKDDLVQEGLLGVLDAIRAYDGKKMDRFYPFAKLCINRKMIKAIDSSNEKKNSPLNSAISLDLEIDSINDYLLDEFMDPERLLLDKENEKKVRSMILKMLSPFEQQVFSQMILGYDYIQIADILDKSPKSIDNAIQRIRSKVKSLRK